MARPVRIEVPGGWYHVTARGNERKSIYWDDRDRLHFLGLLEECVKRYAVRVHAYVLMDNHYHLLVETTQANLSRAMQWLGVSYTVWFNRRHERAGHLFQGRYKAILVEAGGAAWEVSRYVHLNPVRVKGLGLGKREQAMASAGMGGGANRGQVRQRLERLRKYRWSGYRAYVGIVAKPKWLTTGVLLGQLGSGTEQQRQQAYRREVEAMVRDGVEECPWERVEGQVLLGGKRFVRKMAGKVKGDEREESGLKGLKRGRVGWEQVVRAVEKEKGEKWKSFRDRHRDWGRDVVLYLGRMRGGMRLVELGDKVGLDYASVQVAVRRLGVKLRRDAALKRIVDRLEKELYDVAM